LLDEASRKNYDGGILGVRARPEWTTAPEFNHGATLVRVVPCRSALAVWEAITTRDPSQWLVVITDREDEDLGAGIRAHLIGNRLRTPDPWDAVRHRFAATGLDPALTSTPGHREIAVGLLAAAPPDGWPPAPAGVITRDHAFAAVAAAHLAFTDPVTDLTSVLSWTAEPELANRIADLRELAGDPLPTRCSAGGQPVRRGWTVRHLLRAGEARDCLPLGLVAGLLALAGESADTGKARIGREGLIRIEGRLGGSAPGRGALAAWAAECAAVIMDLLADRAARARGDGAPGALTKCSVHAPRASPMNPTCCIGAVPRLASLAAATGYARRSADGACATDQPFVPPEDLAHEQAWSRVDVRVARTIRRLRFTRRSGSPLARVTRRQFQPDRPVMTGSGPDHGRHAGPDAWADSAVDAAAGSATPISTALTAALRRGRTARRSRHWFARRRRHGRRWRGRYPGGGGIQLLEGLLPTVVIPLAKVVPVLLLVLDG
jgi:hypothetical protein